MAHMLLGGTGDYAQAPSSVSYDHATQIDVRADVELTSYATEQTMISRFVAPSSSYMWRFDVLSNFVRFLFLNSAGSSSLPQVNCSTVLTAGERIQLRGFVDLTVPVYRVYSRTDGVVWSASGWTQVGGDVTPTLTDIRTGTSQVVRIGQSDGVRYAAGKVYQTGFAIGGAADPVFDADPSDPTTWTYA